MSHCFLVFLWDYTQDVATRSLLNLAYLLFQKAREPLLCLCMKGTFSPRTNYLESGNVIFLLKLLLFSESNVIFSYGDYWSESVLILPQESFIRCLCTCCLQIVRWCLSGVKKRRNFGLFWGWNSGPPILGNALWLNYAPAWECWCSHWSDCRFCSLYILDEWNRLWVSYKLLIFQSKCAHGPHLSWSLDGSPS